MMIGLIEGSINCSCKVAGNIGRLVTNLKCAAVVLLAEAAFAMKLTLLADSRLTSCMQQLALAET